MSSRQELKEQFDIDVGERRYVTDGSVDLSEIADPTTRQDESSQTPREWAGENRELAIVLSVLGFIGVLIVGYLVYKFAPQVFTNPWTHRSAAAIALFAGGFVIATRSAQGALRRYDWLVLMRSKWQTPKIYLGHYVQATDERRPLFVPTKGVSLLGHRGDPFTIEEVSSELAQRRENANKSPEHPAVIRLNPGFGGDVATWFGSVFVQLSNGLELDPFGQDSTLHAAPPEMGDEDVIAEFRRQVERLESEIQDLESELSVAQEKKKEAIAEAKKTRREHVHEFVTEHGTLNRTRSGRRTTSEGGSVPEEPMDFSDIENELERDREDA